MKQRDRGPQGDKPEYLPSDKERPALKRFLARAATRTAPRVEAPADSTELRIDHPDKRVGEMLLMEAIGTADPDFYAGLLSQLVAIAEDDRGICRPTRMYHRQSGRCV